jgi:predicted aspartyl protease
LDNSHSFTFDYNGISKYLFTPVELQDVKNSKDSIKITALWDTGADCSLIKQEVVSKLNLKYISKGFFSTPSDKKILCNIYVVNLFLPNIPMIPNIQVIEGHLNDCDMLIGMDVITQGDFAVSNFEGNTAFSFRIPSLMKFDFCK